MSRRVIVVLALAAALIVNAWAVGSRTRPAMARSGGTVLDTGVVPANVKVEGDGPPIVLLHGFSAAMDWFDAIAPGLALDHRVVRIDLIGHGGTAAPASGYTITRQAALVAAVLDKLGIDRVTVVGHSMGGEVATALAESAPRRIERLIVIDTPPAPATTFDLTTRLGLTPVLGPFLARLTTEGMIRRGLAQGFAPGFVVSDAFVADFRQLTYTAFRSAHDDSSAYVTGRPTYQRLGALEPVPPLLVIFGSLDRLVPPASAALYERVPGAKVTMIDGVGHSPMLEAPEKTLALIRGFR